ncbi:MAG: glycerate kinase [Nodosilinea sp.]
MVYSSIASVLAPLLEKDSVSDQQWQTLVDWELADQPRAQAWGIDTDNVTDHLQTRLTWLRALAPDHGVMPLPPRPLEAYLSMYWQLWLPLALTLKAARQQLNAPLIQGVLGGQGTGKTTLCQILCHLLGAMGYRAVGLSIDDLYKTHAERAQLRQADPRLRWRGPPGTHDIDLGIATLDQIRASPPGGMVPLPRFDKSLYDGDGDRVQPEPVQGVDVLLFEGWFLGARPATSEQVERFSEPGWSAADRQFAQDMNAQLAAYLPLWDRLNRLMVLYPEDYRISKLWRRQAEQQMKAQGKTGMDDHTIDEFVEYFWKALHPDLFITPLKHDGQHVNLVVEINLDRTPSAIYVPN